MTIISKILFFSQVFLFINFNVKAQIIPAHHYTINDGLISDDVESICQDPSGYLWIATTEGLSSFDSKEFRNYTIEDGLPTDNLSYVLTGKKNTIWIGTIGKGVVKYENNKFVSFGTKLSRRQRNINYLFMDERGVLWCGNEESIFIIKNNKIITFQNSGKIKGVNSITEDSSGNILIGADNGLFAFIVSKKHFIKIKIPLIDHEQITSIKYTPDKSILVLTDNGRLFQVKNRSIKSIRLSRIGYFSNIFNSFSKDYYWITSDHGLFKVEVDLNHFKKVSYRTQEIGLQSSNVSAMFIDREGILWIGITGKGITKIVHINLLKFNIPVSIKNVYNVSTVIDKNQHIWIATSDRLLELWKDDNSIWHQYTHLKLTENVKKPLAKLYMEKRSRLVVTFFSHTIKEYNIINIHPSSNIPSKLVQFNSIDLLKKYKFHGLFVSMIDKNGYLWTSALDVGVVVLNNNKDRRVLKIYTKKDGLLSNSIRCIYQDKQGNYWFGGYDKGLTYFSKDKVRKDLNLNYDESKVKIKKYTVQTGLPNNDIRAITQDDKGNLYVGTRYGGLVVLRNGKFKVTSKINGLLSNGIWDIKWTKNFGIWLATQSGIQKLNSDGKPSYELFEDIPKIPFYSIAFSKNKMVFASPTEVYVYELENSKLKKIPPSIFINKILVNGKKYHVQNKIDLSNSQNNITIDFIDILNREEHNRKYKYQLLTKDTTWNNLVDRNSVTYASLDPGTYTFQVIAIAPDGMKSKQPAQITFRIDAPFYQELWFDLIIFLIMISIIVVFVRARVRRLLAIERVREKIASELHDEIGAGLTKIAILSEHALMKNTSSETNSKEQTPTKIHNKSIERVGFIARNLVDQLVDVIWSIDPKYDKLEDFIIHFKNYAYEVCEAKNIKLAINTHNINNVKLNSQIKRKLHLISMEALNNALKHSNCSEINYHLKANNKSIIIEFRDNGKGFTDDMFGKGNGLINMKKNIQLLNGIISFKSIINKGTTIIIQIPIKT